MHLASIVVKKYEFVPAVERIFITTRIKSKVCQFEQYGRVLNNNSYIQVTVDMPI